MVDKDANAKIMDFGIARSLRAAGMTAEGTIIGTPDYMAPEQVEGLEADQRTDIYALGAILFEMVTGRVLFEGNTPLSVAYKHKNEMPLPPRKLNSQIPEPLNQLILRCLEKEKENRYQTADDLLADLVRIEEGLPLSERVILKARPTIRIAREKPTGLRRFRIPAAIALVLVVAAVIISRTVFYEPLPPPPTKTPNSIAIISFENLTGEKDLDVWTRCVPELLITNLENTGYFHVTTWERMRDILKQMGKKDIEYIDSNLGFELCRRAGIESLVTGTVKKAGDMFALDVRVLDAETKELRKSAGTRGEGIDSIIKTQTDELSREIAEGLGATKEKIEQTRFQVAKTTTASPEAYNLFIIGMERNEKYDSAKAAEYLEKAVQIDPEFAIAYHELGRAYYYHAKHNASREAFTKAMELSARASNKDRMRIEASYTQHVERNLEKSTIICEEIIKRYPDDKWSRWDLGWIYFRQSRYADAVEAFKESLRLDPDFGYAHNSLGYVYAELGEFENAVETLKKYAALTPGEANPWDSLGYAYASMGNIEEAIKSYKEALKIWPDFYLPNMCISYLFAFKEHYAEALESIDHYLSLNLSPENRAKCYLWKGFCLYWLGRFSQSLEAIGQAEEAGQTADWTGKGAVIYLMFKLYYNKGDLEQARQSAQRFVDHNIENHVKSKAFNVSFGDYLYGLCYLKEGRLDQAKTKLKEMKSLLQDVSGGEKESLAENISLLQTDINLAEGPIEEALYYLEQNAPYRGSWSSFQRIFGTFGFYTIFDNNWPKFREGLARAYMEKGYLDRAIAEYERLIAPDPKKTSALIHPRFYYSLGKLYERKGNKFKARAHYERFLELWKDADPGIAEVEDAKKRLVGL